MVHMVMLLASIVTTVAGSTPVVLKHRCPDASLLTWHVWSESYAAETYGPGPILLYQGLTFGMPAKNIGEQLKHLLPGILSSCTTRVTCLKSTSLPVRQWARACGLPPQLHRLIFLARLRLFRYKRMAGKGWLSGSGNVPDEHSH